MTTYTSVWSTPGSPTTLNSSTSINSLADDDIANLETGIDNTSNRHRHAAFELDFGANLDLSSANDHPACYLYAFPSFDGTNYADTANETDETAVGGYKIGTFGFLKESTARRAVIENVDIAPLKYMFALYNDLGAAMPASGATVKVKTYTDEVSDA